MLRRVSADMRACVVTLPRQSLLCALPPRTSSGWAYETIYSREGRTVSLEEISHNPQADHAGSWIRLLHIPRGDDVGNQLVLVALGLPDRQF